MYTIGAKTFGVGLGGQTTTHVKNYSLVWEIRSPIFMYMVFYESKRQRGRKHRRPLPRGLKFSGWSFWDNLRPCKIIVMLCCVVWENQSPPFSCIWSYMKRKDIGLGNIEDPYPGAWNLQGGALKDDISWYYVHFCVSFLHMNYFINVLFNWAVKMSIYKIFGFNTITKVYFLIFL